MLSRERVGYAFGDKNRKRTMFLISDRTQNSGCADFTNDKLQAFQKDATFLHRHNGTVPKDLDLACKMQTCGWR
jgi:hypothetical protein